MNGWIDPANYGPHSRQWLGHYFRYHLARGFVRPDETVVDAACGVGYGSQVLASVAGSVIAIDGDEKALQRARTAYAAPNITWRCADLDNLEHLPQADVVVSFETVEHLQKPIEFIRAVGNVAQRLIIMSAPVIPTVGINPHHVTDFTEAELIRLVLGETGFVLFEQVRQGPYLIIVAYRAQDK